MLFDMDPATVVSHDLFADTQISPGGADARKETDQPKRGVSATETRGNHFLPSLHLTADELLLQ